MSLKALYRCRVALWTLKSLSKVLLIIKSNCTIQLVDILFTILWYWFPAQHQLSCLFAQVLYLFINLFSKWTSKKQIPPPRFLVSFSTHRRFILRKHVTRQQPVKLCKNSSVIISALEWMKRMGSAPRTAPCSLQIISDVRWPPGVRALLRHVRH